MSARVVTLLTVVRYKGEFAVVEVRMCGDAVVSREVLETTPDSDTMWAIFMAHSKKQFMRKERAN